MMRRGSLQASSAKMQFYCFVSPLSAWVVAVADVYQAFAVLREQALGAGLAGLQFLAPEHGKCSWQRMTALSMNTALLKDRAQYTPGRV
jgi:hypothetical protein